MLTNDIVTCCVLVCLLVQSACAQAQPLIATGTDGENSGVRSVKHQLTDDEREAEPTLRKLGVSIGRDENNKVNLVRIRGPQFTDNDIAHLETLAFGKEASTIKVGRWATWNFPSLSLDRTRITDEGLARLCQLTDFRFLSLADNAAITNNALKQLHLPQLKGIRISNTGITGDGLVYLKKLKKLEFLSIHGTKGITARGIEHLNEVTSLKGIELCGQDITDDCIVHISSNVTSLSLEDTQITDAGLLHILSLENLTELSVVDRFFSPTETPVTDAGVKHLASMKNLEVLHLRRLGLSDRSVKHLKSLKRLVRLRLAGNQISNDGLADLQNLVHIRQLELTNNKVTDSGLVHLKPLADLEQLYLVNNNITDRGLVHLTHLANLRLLQLHDTKVSKQGIDKLGKELPNCDIEAGKYIQSYILEKFSRLDLNGDGKLTSNEMAPRDKSALLSVDANGDGILSRDELVDQTDGSRGSRN